MEVKKIQSNFTINLTLARSQLHIKENELVTFDAEILAEWGANEAKVNQTTEMYFLFNSF